jgi:RNA polymerase sigma-70 factor (ECF subfamily)
VDPDDFLRWCGVRALHEPRLWLDRAKGADLLLAFACIRRDPAALAAFDRAFMPKVRQLLGKMLSSKALAEDVAQTLSQQWLTSTPDHEGSLAQYNGLGRLQGWVRVSTVREAVRARRKAGFEVASKDDAFAAIPTDDADPELAYMRQLYSVEFREALAEAVASLTPRERTLLRYSVTDGLTVDDLARIFRVHRASTARWLASARETLTHRTRAALTRRLGVRVNDQESILRLIQSQLDVSVRSLFATSANKR